MGDKKNILGGLLLAGSMCVAQAQTAVDINGTVTNAKSGAAVVGAKVSLVGNPDVKTTTGADGKFHLVGNATVGIQSAARDGKADLAFKGNELSFNVSQSGTPVLVDLYNLKSEHVRNLVSKSATAGKYTVNAMPSDLAGGVYFVRAKVGNQTASFRMSTVGMNAKSGALLRNAATARTGLAKTAIDYIDSLKIEGENYKPLSKALSRYAGTFLYQMNPKLPVGDLKIVSERNMPQVDWGSNVDVQVWDGGTQLNGGFKDSPFEGPQSWLISFVETQPYNAWGFVARAGTPEDMGAWKDGSMHLAVKGTASSVGVTMGSIDQAGGNSVKVDLRKYGYVGDNAWHEVLVPLSDFTGTDFTNIDVYCGLVYPVTDDLAPFDPAAFYQVDDIYWKTTK